MSTNFDNTRTEELYDELHDWYSGYVLKCEEERTDGGSFEDWLDLEDCRDEKDEYLILVKLAKQGK